MAIGTPAFWMPIDGVTVASWMPMALWHFGLMDANGCWHPGSFMPVARVPMGIGILASWMPKCHGHPMSHTAVGHWHLERWGGNGHWHPRDPNANGHWHPNGQANGHCHPNHSGCLILPPPAPKKPGPQVVIGVRWPARRHARRGWPMSHGDSGSIRTLASASNNAWVSLGGGSAAGAAKPSLASGSSGGL